MKKPSQLWKRIFSQHAVLILIAFLFVFLSISFTMSNSMERDRRNTMDQQLAFYTSKLDARVEDVMSLHSQLLNDTSFRQYLQAYYDGRMTGAQQNRLDQMLYDAKEASWLVNTIYVLDTDFQIISSSRVILSEDQNIDRVTACAEDLSQSRAFRSFYYSEEKLLFVGAVYLDNSYHYVTYIAIEINPSRMFYNFTTTALKSFQAVLVAQNNQVICIAGDITQTDPAALANTRSVTLNKTAYSVFHSRSSSYANWDIYALMDHSTFHQAIARQTGIVGTVLLMTIIATLVISLLFSTRITRPLHQLTRSFHRLEQGEFPPPLPVESSDEIGQLIHSYNHVVQSLEKLNENILAEQEAKRQFEIAAVKTRLDLLQSQIQPHFIHNTLNTLKFMAIEAGNTDLSELITSFNALLRMSISTESDFCTVESEIACIKHYLRIQRSRYADRSLQCSYTVDEEVKDALLPRLVLQPLVENALYHGILPMEDRLGVIQVQCTAVGDQLCVSVSDNGSGIPDEVLRQIKQGKVLSSSGYTHIGINNVKERLQLMYRQECEFKIISEIGSGTTIFFSVPFKR